VFKKLAFETFGGSVSLSFSPLLWGGGGGGGCLIFSFKIRFPQLLVCHMHQEEGFKFCLDTRNNKTLPLDPACPEHLVFNHQSIYPIWFSVCNQKYKRVIKGLCFICVR
jgi:hypothetical protein